MEILPPVRKNMIEPRVYAVLVKAKQGQVLHLGVHYSLDEAYSAARTKMEGLHPEFALDAVDIDLWNSLQAKSVIPQLLDIYIADMSVDEKKLLDPNILPTTKIPLEDINSLPNIIRSLIGDNKEELIKDITTDEYVQGLKDMKNDLMKKLIEEGDVSKVDGLKSLLGPVSYKYVVNQITKSEIKK